MNSEAMDVQEASPKYGFPAAKPAVPVGYQQTEVGVIPKDWGIARIDEHASIKTGSRNTQDRLEDGAYPFFVRSQKVEHINSYSYDGEAVLTAGDGVGTGKIFHYVNGKFDVHQRVYRISDFSTQLDGRYFFSQFSTRFYDRIMAMTAKSSVDSVRMEMIAGMQIALPPIQEQHAIATALSDVDALLEELDRLIAKKRAIKQATMQQLLTGQTRLPGFEGEWEEMRLGDLGHFLKGSGVRRHETQTGSLPCVRYGEIYTVHHDVIRNFYSWISKDVANTAVQIRKGDLLFAGSGETKDEIGKCVAVATDNEAYAGGDIVILRAPKADPVFMGYALNQPAVNLQKSSFGQGDAVVHISASALSQIAIKLPSKIEQNTIAIVLSDMDAEIRVLEQRRAKTAALNQAMMQELMTGRTRLL